MLDWQIGTIISIQHEAPATKRFFIELKNGEAFNFEAGQFVTLDLPIHEQKNKRWRSYSISSAPDGSSIFELVIVFLEGGAGTSYLFNEATIGTELSFRGPVGKFTLPQTIENDLFFICTGTGVAPFRSMIHDIKNKAKACKNLYLIFGCRTLNDCLYKDELLQLQNEMPNFHYLPCFSREETIEPWANKGYVHEAYKKVIAKKMEDGVVAPANFYLCGWKNMIDEAKQTIVDLGYDKKAIHLELYG